MPLYETTAFHQILYSTLDLETVFSIAESTSVTASRWCSGEESMNTLKKKTSAQATEGCYHQGTLFPIPAKQY